MREYSANFTVHVGDNIVSSCQGYACYAPLFSTFGDISKYRRKLTEVKSYFWLDSKTLEEDADWYLKKFVLPSIPTHMKGQFKFYKEPNDVKHISLTGPGDKYWITLSLDPTKMCAFDMFALLTLVRYAQEQPQFAAGMRLLLKTKKYNKDQAFFVANCLHTNLGWGHLLIPSQVYFTLSADDKIKTTSKVKDLWTNQPGERQPFVKSDKKVTLHSVFVPEYNQQPAEI